MVLGIIEYGEFNDEKFLAGFHGNFEKKIWVGITIFHFLRRLYFCAWAKVHVYVHNH